MKKTISQEAMNAAYIASLLSGKDLSTKVDVNTDDLIMEDEEQVQVEVVFEDEITKEKKKRTKKASGEKKKEDEPKKVDKLPDWKLGEIKKETKFPVKFNAHDIPYKEQLWPIEERTVMYVLARVEIPQQAVNIAERIHSKGTNVNEWKAKARTGENRYLLLLTHDENVKGEVRQLAYVEVTADKKVRFLIEKEICERNHVDTDLLNEYMKKASKFAVEFNK